MSAPSPLTRKSHHFHHIPSVKGWVSPAASLLEICRGGEKKNQKKKSWLSYTPHTVLTCNGYRVTCMSPQTESLINLLRYNWCSSQQIQAIQLVPGSTPSEQQPKSWPGLRLYLHFTWSLALTGEELRGQEPKFPHVQPPLRGPAQRMRQCCGDRHFGRPQG